MILIPLQERIKQRRVAVDTALANLVKLEADLRGSNAFGANVASSARVVLTDMARTAEELAVTLQPYSEPGFYAGLPPSLATEDQGKHAAAVLDRLFPE